MSSDDFIGNKIQDFEFLSFLGEGAFSSVLKVRSLINQKIYVMKMIKIEENDDMKKYYKSEILMLQTLNHKNIVKYYTHFKGENRLYIIMEYLEGDLNDYINLLLNLNLNKQNKNIIQIKKGEIIHIFLQCINALKYLKGRNIIHRDIKPENIFISKKEGIKLGDFGVSAINKKGKDIKVSAKSKGLKVNENTVIGTHEYMSPEVKDGKKYNEKADIYSMGLIFYKIYFLEDFRKKEWNLKSNIYKLTFIKKQKPENNNDPIIDFIFSMIEEDPNKRPDVDILLEQINKIYFNYFINNNSNSFFSVIKCLGNFPYLREYFKKEYTAGQYSYCDYFYKYIINQDNWKETIFFYKQKFYEENRDNFFELNRKITPFSFLNFILHKIHMELLNNENINEVKSIISQKCFQQDLNEKFKQDFSLNFRTKIGNNFSCILRTYYQCTNCKNLFDNYSYFFYLSFDLNTFLSKLPNKFIDINILDLFKYQNDIILTPKNDFKFYCTNCKKENVHREKKIFYYLPYCLIINFERKQNNVNKVIFPEELDLSCIERGLSKVSAKKYYLIGIIKSLNENYISIIFDYSKEHKWLVFDNNKINIFQNFKEHNIGNVEMLFYFSRDEEINRI